MPDNHLLMSAKSVATFYALGTIALWATLAAMGVALKHLPPFLLTGLALTIGSVPGWFRIREWKLPLATLALGVYGLFGYHLLLFIALRHAPPVEANLINYLWPLLIVVLSPLILRDARLTWKHALAACMGFSGAAIAILGGGEKVHALRSEYIGGYLAALGAAFIWATYSLGTKRIAPFPTAAVGLFCLVSGLLALLCHALFEPPAVFMLSAHDWGLIGLIGFGPLGIAFYLWDKALKLGDARQIGILSYLTPCASTLLLVWVSGCTLDFSMVLATALIVGAAILGMRTR